MTVSRDPAAANESSSIQNSSGAGSDSRKLKDFFSGRKASDRENDRVLYGKLKACGEIETDQESTGSSEDVESPRSVVAKMRKWPNSLANKNMNLYVHSQILRIREEDSHIGEDIAENLSTIGAAMNNNKLSPNESDDDHRYHHVDVWIFYTGRFSLLRLLVARRSSPNFTESNQGREAGCWILLLAFLVVSILSKARM